jgi:hypothetical protein
MFLTDLGIGGKEMSRGELDDYAIRAIVEKFEIMRAECSEVCRGCMLNLSDEGGKSREGEVQKMLT